jgi:hypothetical protein
MTSTNPDPLPPPWRTCVSGLQNCGYSLSQTFTCSGCQREVCWCDGGNEDDLCNACFKDPDGTKKKTKTKKQAR